MKVIFLFNFPRLSKEEETVEKKQWSKQSNLATSREDIRETHSSLAYCFTELLFFYRPVLSHLNVVYPVFSKFGSFSQTENVSDAQ